MKQGDFTKVAKHYKARPAYSAWLLKKLIACINDEQKPLSELKVADVGAGTGKLSALLASEFKLKLSAVEPNEAMRSEGIKDTQNLAIKWLEGSAERTNLPSGEFDWVLMASSFHWSDPSKSLPEFARVLKERKRGGGMAILQTYGILAT